jgi:hypothetical protein
LARMATRAILSVFDRFFYFNVVDEFDFVVYCSSVVEMYVG